MCYLIKSTVCFKFYDVRVCVGKESKIKTDEDHEKKQKRLQQTKAKKMEAQEQIWESFEIKGIKMHPKYPKLVNLLSTRKTKIKQEKVVECKREQSESGDIHVNGITQPEMSSQPDQLSAPFREVTDYVKSIAADFETQLQKQNELLAKINSLKDEILAFTQMSEETQQRCRQEIQSSSTATNQPQQRHPGNTN